MRNPIGSSWLVLPLVVLAAALAWPDAGAQEQEVGKRDRLERLWDHLAGADAGKAYQAILSLAQTPKETTAFIRERLQPVATPDAAKVKQWIEELSSNSFAVRSKATAELQKLAELVEPSLQSAVRNAPSLETRRRVEELLSKLQGPVIALPAQLRALRAVEALEYGGHDDAKALLRIYAAGAPAARLTQASAAALGRLARRPAEAPLASAKKPRIDRYGDALPAGAVARLGTIRFRRESPYLADLAFLPDKKTLLTASRDNQIQVWEIATGRLVRELATKPFHLRGFALAPTGKQFAVADDRVPEIRVFDLLSGNVVKVFARNQMDGYTELAFSPDGKLLLSLCGVDGMLRIEEIGTGKELHQKQFLTGERTRMALSADGQRLAIAGIKTNKLVLWNWRTEERRDLEIPDRGNLKIGFSFDSRLLAVVGEEGDGLLQVWDVPGGRLLYQRRSAAKYAYHGPPVFTPDGKTLAVPASHGHGSRSRGEIQLLDPRTGKLQGVLDGQSYWIAVSADSRRLATAAGNGLRIWDLASRTEVAANDEAHSRPIMRMKVSSTGLVATAGEDESVRLWDGTTGEQHRKYLLDERAVDVCFSPDGSVLVASSPNDLMPVWDTRTGREIYRLAGHGRDGGYRALGFLPDGRRFLSWGDDQRLRMWDMKNGRALFEHLIDPGVNPVGDPRLGLGDAVITPDGKTLIASYGAKLLLLDPASGKQKRAFPSGGEEFGPMAVSPDSKYFLTVPFSFDEPQPATLWSVATGLAAHQFSVPGLHGGPAAFSPDGRALAVAARLKGTEMFVYEIASGQVRCTIRGIRGPIHCLAFLPDSRRLAAGLNDSTALIWDLRELSGK